MNRLTMPREILFRGFHEEENGSTTIYVDGREVKGKWLYGFVSVHTIICGEKTYLTTVIEVTPQKIYDDGTSYEVIPSTVGQYTGLYGEDEKRIFEGDKCIVTVFDHEGSDRQHSCKVGYDEGCFSAGNDTGLCVLLQEIGDTQTDVTVTGTTFDKEVDPHA